jgi:hypothetical protein
VLLNKSSTLARRVALTLEIDLAAKEAKIASGKLVAAKAIKPGPAHWV